MIDELDEFLMSDETPGDCMRLSDLDGFLTGTVVDPELIMPSEWFPTIWQGPNQFTEIILRRCAAAHRDGPGFCGIAAPERSMRTRDSAVTRKKSLRGGGSGLQIWALRRFTPLPVGTDQPPQGTPAAVVLVTLFAKLGATGKKLLAPTPLFAGLHDNSGRKVSEFLDHDLHPAFQVRAVRVADRCEADLCELLCDLCVAHRGAGCFNDRSRARHLVRLYALGERVSFEPCVIAILIDHWFCLRFGLRPEHQRQGLNHLVVRCPGQLDPVRRCSLELCATRS